jgi:hypothetical protein
VRRIPARASPSLAVTVKLMSLSAPFLLVARAMRE